MAFSSSIEFSATTIYILHYILISMQISLASLKRKDFSIRTMGDLDGLGDLTLLQGQWIDFSDYDSGDLKTVGEKFGIDSLTLEDISVGKQRIKVEDYSEYLFAVSKGVYTMKSEQFGYITEEIFIVLTQKNILTFHKSESQIIKHAGEAMKNRARTIKNEGIFTSAIVYTIFDFSVDSFYTALSDIENWLDNMRSEVLDFASLKASTLDDVRDLMSLISRARREMSELRVMLTQHRDVTSLAERGAVKFISMEITPSFRDIYDHTFQLIETVDSYMSRTGDVRDLYFTLRSAFTDNILRLLTIVATIFLPLTFLTGFYGMNFTNGYLQPGTSTPFGFYALIASMILMPAILLLLFKRRGWL